MDLRRALIALLLPAMLLAQLAGFVHGVAHAPIAQGVVQQDKASTHSHGFSLAGLFQAHDEATCRLYDQLSHGEGAPCVPTVLPALLPPATFVLELHGLALARWAALFDARGPPSLR